LTVLLTLNVIGCVSLLILEYETYKSFKTSGLSIIRESLIDNVKENGKKGIDGLYAWSKCNPDNGFKKPDDAANAP